MTPAEFKEARRKPGLSAQETAAVVRVADGRTVRRWESGDRDIPGPVVALPSIWLDPRCPEWGKPTPAERERD